MKVLVLLLLVMAVLAAVMASRKMKVRSGPDEWPFFAKRPLSPPEQVLYHRLVRALPECIVLAQVQCSRILGVKKGFSFHAWNNRINRLSYDFVICSTDATVLAAIELDDRTHERPARVKTDFKKEKATAAAGVRFIRWRVSALPDPLEIRRAVEQELPDAPLALPGGRKEPTL